jgi:hypothetical protein
VLRANGCGYSRTPFRVQETWAHTSDCSVPLRTDDLFAVGVLWIKTILKLCDQQLCVPS